MKTNMEKKEALESPTASDEDAKSSAKNKDVGNTNDTTDESLSASHSDESTVSEEELKVEQIVLARTAQSDYVQIDDMDNDTQEKAMNSKLSSGKSDPNVASAAVSAAADPQIQKGNPISNSEIIQSTKNSPQVVPPPSEVIRREPSNTHPSKEGIPGTTRLNRSVTEPVPGAYAVSGTNDSVDGNGAPTTNLGRAVSAPGAYAVNGVDETQDDIHYTPQHTDNRDSTQTQLESGHSATVDIEAGVQGADDDSREGQGSSSAEQRHDITIENEGDNGEADITIRPEEPMPLPPSDGLIFAESEAFSHISSGGELIEAELVEEKLVVDAVATPSRNRLLTIAVAVCIVVSIVIIVIALVVTNSNKSEPSPSPPSNSAPISAPVPLSPTTEQPTDSGLSYSQRLQLGQTIIGAAPFDLFGAPLSLSSDGTIVAIGARNSDEDGTDSGVVRVYSLDEEFGLWRPRGNTIRGENSGDKFGFSGLAINEAGNRLVAGAWLHKGREEKPDAGQIRVFDYNEDTTFWDQVGQSVEGLDAYDQFGRSAAMSGDGKIFASSSYQSNENGNFSAHVRVFEETMVNGTVIWEQMGQTLLGKFAYARFGRSLALSTDGLRLASGANEFQGTGPGYAQVFDYNGTDWVQVGQDLVGENDNDQFGRDLSISKDGSILSVGANFGDDNGSASGYVKTYTLETLPDGSLFWQEVVNKIVGDVEEDRFGETISLSDDGSRIAVGASQRRAEGTGFVRIFDMAEDNEGRKYWQQAGEDLLGEVLGERFGAYVHLSANGTIVSCGVVGSDVNGDDSGAARIFNISDI